MYFVHAEKSVRTLCRSLGVRYVRLVLHDSRFVMLGSPPAAPSLHVRESALGGDHEKMPG